MGTILVMTDQGGGVSFTPASLTGLVAWYSADNGVYSDGGVTLATNGQGAQQWNDQSGLGNHQSGPFIKPVFQSAGFNGKQAVVFSAAAFSFMSTFRLSNSQIVAMGTGNTGSCFVVCQMLTGTVSNGRLVSYVGNGETVDTAATTSSAWILRDGSNNGFSTFRGGFLSADAISLATNVRIGSIYDGVNETPYLNNVAGTPTANSSSWSTPGNINLSINDNSTSSAAPWDGAVAEIVITKTALSSGDRLSLDNYFKTKWGL